jgi:aminomethyltransferase
VSPGPELLRSPIADRIVGDGQQVEDIYGMEQPLVVDDLALEYAAVREGVGILDFSPLTKVDIEGADARAKMNGLYTRNIEKLAVGRIAYGAILNEDGGIIDDSTVMVRSPERLRMAGSPLMPGVVIPWAEERGLRAVERRSELAHINIQGPRSRDLLAKLVSIDISNEAFPYYTLKDSVVVAGIDEVMITRMGFTAELGYELFVPVDCALDAYDAIIEAGAEFGARPVGVLTILTVRLEAGMIMGEFEYDESVSPWEASLGWAVDLDKGGFQGRDAALRLREERSGRLISVVLEGGEDAATGARLATSTGEEIGHVTMAMPSPFLGGKTLGLARVDKQHVEPGTRVLATVGEEEIAGELVATPVYDPGRTRVRS